MKIDSDQGFSDEPTGFDSSDCEYIILNGPGDRTVRPLRPSLMAAALAERERMARRQKLLEQEGKDQAP